jgi:opacity protein-like surface antigen
MKRTVLVVVLALMIAATSSAQKVEPVKGIISLQGAGYRVAPVGVELEFLLGSVGLSVESRLFVLKSGGDWVGALEPGINLRYYFGDVDGSLFLFTGLSFLSLWQFSPFSLDQGILKPRAGLGYNWLLGEQNSWRLGLEVGTSWLQELVQGDRYDILFPLVPHILLLLGKTF